MNCHFLTLIWVGVITRTSDDIGMKFGPVTKLDKKNKTTSKKFDDDVISESCYVIAIFLIYGQFGAIGSQAPDAQSVKLIF